MRKAEHTGDDGQAGRKKQRVQPGFEPVEPGMTPKMKNNLEPGERENTGGRFSKQLSELPDKAPDDE